jgi:hypothetical protein
MPTSLARSSSSVSFPFGSNTHLKGSVTVLLLSLLMGCSKTQQPTAGGFTTNAGNFTLFLLEQTIQRGGHPNTNGLTAIPADWRYTSPNGLQTLIFLSGDRFSEIQSVLSRSFGEPDPARGSTPVRLVDSESRMGWYSSDQIGVSIQFIGWTNQTHINIMGRLKR